MGKIRITHVSRASIVLTVCMGALCAALFASANTQLGALCDASQNLVECEEALTELQQGSDALTKEARLAVATGNAVHVSLYYQEADNEAERASELSTIGDAVGKDSAAYRDLESAIDRSRSLMDDEAYAMRLALEGAGTDVADIRDELQEVELSQADAALSAAGKSERARELVMGGRYESAKSLISTDTQSASDSVMHEVRRAQNRARAVVDDVFLKVEVVVAVFAAISLFTAFIMRREVVRPLVSYGESIVAGGEFSVTGVYELRRLADTYNRVYRENEETQRLIRHQAEHDALTDLLNRGSYDKILSIYEKGDRPFALILLDVDVFKSVNDTYGHATGDKILREVAGLLRTAFRTIDHVCRIGGDEFAVIMVEVTSDLAYTVEEKIDFMNERLGAGENGLPPVSVSAGAAFTDRDDPGESLFKDADRALYRTKENGRRGCTIHGKNKETAC